MDKLLCLEYTAIYSMGSAGLNTDKTDLKSWSWAVGT